jgi:Collagen triple helix repeat (20 copies)
LISSIHQKLGTAGFVIAIVALVAALGGGAYAASGGLTGKQKKEVEKIAKKYAGKPGAAGATGPSGASGKDGSNGATGAQGGEGKQGAQGVQGAPGQQGQPGTTGFVSELPPGETESGIWATTRLTTEETALGTLDLSIQFPFPLPEGEGFAHGDEPAEVLLRFVKKGEAATTECPGSATEPLAAEGFVCVYEGYGPATLELPSGSNFEPESGENNGGASRRGIVAVFTAVTGGRAGGTWAVTARS